MLATVGFVVPEFFRIPGAQFSFEAILLEACSFPALANMNNYDREPGNFGFDPLGLYPTDPKRQKDYQLSELKNGRLAMIAIGGMVAGAAVTGNGFPYLP